MPKFKVKLELASPIYVEAVNEDDAVDKAFDEVYGDPDSIDLVVASVMKV